MNHFPRGRQRKKIVCGGLFAAGLLAVLFVVRAGPALVGQDFSGANQSDDACYKIKQMKKAILESADYKKAAGNRDPSYIQCRPLTVTVDWKLTDSIVHRFGKDWIAFDLQEEYPAYLMLHYGWFDKLQKGELRRFEIMGPEPCWPPCPGRAKAELALNGQAIICKDYYNNCQPAPIDLSNFSYTVNPSKDDGQKTFMWIKWEGGQTSGSINSASMRAKPETKPKGRGVVAWTGHFWNEGQYQIELGGSGIHTNELHHLSLNSDWTAEEIFEGIKTGTLTKVLPIQITEKGIGPDAPTCSLQGAVTVRIAFAPVQEERWRVTIKGRETDNRKPYFVYKDQNGKSWSSSMQADFDLNVVGEFVIRKVKTDWSYKEGRVAKAESVIKFTHSLPSDYYQCSIQDCPGEGGISGLGGSTIEGVLKGKQVKLTWAGATAPRTQACVFCKPLKSFLGKIPYKQEFGSGEFIYNLNKEVLPLQNGWTANRQVGDFLKYTITVTKIQ